MPENLTGFLRPGYMIVKKQKDDEILTVSQVARLLKVHPRTIYKLAKRGGLPGFQVGKQWRFLRSELIKLLTKPQSSRRSPSWSRRSSSPNGRRMDT